MLKADLSGPVRLTASVVVDIPKDMTTSMNVRVRLPEKGQASSHHLQSLIGLSR